MNREIKFRVWINNGIVYSNDIYGDVDDEYLIALSGEMVYMKKESNGNYCPDSLVSKTINEKVLMQFTGLKDKNGKEIYEGDIVQGYYGGNLKYSPDVVEFIDGYFGLKSMSLSLHAWLEFDGVYTAELEVIGKNKMKKWEAAASNWLKNISKFNQNGRTHQQTFNRSSKPGTPDEQADAADRF